MQEYGKLARAIVSNANVPAGMCARPTRHQVPMHATDRRRERAGPPPPDFYDRLISQAPVPREDTQPTGNAFGAVKRGTALTPRTQRERERPPFRVPATCI
jgi:hypothetical protein